MKRRLLSAFLAVMMVLTMAPVAFAADDTVAKIGDNGYTTLAEAVNAATEGQTVTLLEDVLVNSLITVAHDITIDLNQKTITGGVSTQIFSTVADSNVTIQNGTINAGQNGSAVYAYGTLSLKNVKISGEAKTYSLLNVENDSNVTVDENSVIHAVTTTRDDSPAIFVGKQNASADEKQSLHIYGSVKADKTPVIQGNGTDRSVSYIYIYDGATVESQTVACYLPQPCEVNIMGGTVKGYCALGMKSGTVNISGGTVQGVANDSAIGDQYSQTNGISYDGSAILIDSYIGYAGQVQINISGNAKVESLHSTAIREIGNTASKTNMVALNVTGGQVIGASGMQAIYVRDVTKPTVKVSGGTFSSDVSAYCEKNYYTEQNADNTYTVKSLKDVAVAQIDDTYYKTLADAVAAAKDGETVTLLKNVVLNSTLTLNKNMTLDLNGCEISNGSTMGTNYLVSIAANADVSIVGKKENSKISDSRSNAQGTITAVVVYGKLTVEGDNLTISRGANGIAVKVEDNPGTLTVNGGTITVDKPTQTSSQAIQNWGNATINGGVFNGDVDSYAYIAANKNYVGNMTIKNGTFDGEVFAAQYTNDGVTWPTKSAKVSIVGGNFKGNIAEYYHNGNKGPQPVEKVNKPDNAAESEVTVSGGYFTVDPTAYLARYTGTDNSKKYVAGAINESPYFFRVALVENNQIPVVPAVGETAAPSKEELKKTGMTEEAAKAVAEAAQEVAAGDTEIKEAVAPIATGITDEKAAKYQQAAANDVDDVEKIEVRAYLEVKPTAYNGSAYTLDITPKYDVVVVGTKNGATAKKVVETNTLNVTKATEVSVQLPEGFVTNTDNLYVQHKGHEYDAAVTANNGVYTANFTNPDGFSEFTISKTSQSVAKVGNNKYITFQDAVNAVENNGTIAIVGGNKDYTATISGDSKTFTVKNTLDSDITVKVNNDSKTVGKDNGTQSFTYTKPSSGGSSGGSSSGKTTYKVTTSAVNNGGVNASPSSAEKGASITITLSPDKGYKLDKLTVTDGSGKTVSTVKKSDTVYTFTMPASAVNVGVSYVKATETPSKTKFNDVSANDWFASAVDYVTGKGMMNGTADNTFSPKANTTRGMVVTVLYRLENQPSTSAASFTDVASGAYYANAVAWANANGIVSGYGSGKFGPNDKVTREQLAAILYRYAQYKKYDVSGANSLDGYTDVQSVSSYAVPALQWANAAGVVTGKSGSKLDPKGNATRAEVAAMLMRFCENVK